MNRLTHNLGRTVYSHRLADGAHCQLELAFAAPAVLPPVSQDRRRVSRATWWFERMRQIVDCACVWEPALPARPEQIWFPGSHRTISTAP